jgi:exosortase
LWQWGVFVALLAWIYHGILWRLVEQWWRDPDFSHGFLVPLFCAFVAWQNRNRLAEITWTPSWWGLVIVAGSLATLVVGVLGAELFLSRSSLILLLAGLIILFLGWPWFRAVLFPWACLFLMIPIPTIIYNQITLPLQFFASRLASGMLGLSGVPVLREGNIIHLPVMDLEIVEACSGIRSLLSLTTLAVIYAYFLERRLSHRIFIIVAAVPIAVVANGMRIMGTGLAAQYWSPDKAEGFFHMFAGWVIFLLSLGLLFLLHGALRWIANQLAAVAGQRK